MVSGIQDPESQQVSSNSNPHLACARPTPLTYNLNIVCADATIWRHDVPSDHAA